MSSKDWFGVALRILGVWTMIEGLRGFVTVFGYWKEWFGPPDQSHYYFMNSTMELVAGIILMRGADTIIKFCYPETIARSMEDEFPDA